MALIIARKEEMSQLFGDDGKLIPVTKVRVESDIKVSKILTMERDGYQGVQVAFDFNSNQQPKYTREFRINNTSDFKVGDEITSQSFTEGQEVVVIGKSKGKGFSGVMKRHGFHGSKATHGTKHHKRAPGSIGAGYPQHVLKGRRMAGRGGSTQITLKNIEIVKIDSEQGIMYLKGALPGPRKSLLKIVG
jgi:large subunit ribosomal protein L3